MVTFLFTFFFSFIINSQPCPKKIRQISYNKATVKNKANIRQFWGVVKMRQTARNTPVIAVVAKVEVVEVIDGVREHHDHLGTILN